MHPRHLVPRPAVQFPPGFLLPNPSPLLEEERDVTIHALLSDVFDPYRVHGPGAKAGLPADDDPVDVSKVYFPQGAEERLEGQELGDGAGLPEVIDPVEVVLVLHGHAHPDVFPPRKNTV